MGGVFSQRLAAACTCAEHVFGADMLAVSCRLPLSQASACMSLGMFLSLCFSTPGLEVLGRPLHSGFVRCAGCHAILRLVVPTAPVAVGPADTELAGAFVYRGLVEQVYVCVGVCMRQQLFAA